MTESQERKGSWNHFGGYFPVIIDIETGGFDCKRDALLELAATTISLDPESNTYSIDETIHFNIKPFEGANLEAESLAFNKINPNDESRNAISEKKALTDLFEWVRVKKNAVGCRSALITGHNVNLDASFVRAAAERCGLKRSPFHPFSQFDTMTMAGTTCGKTRLDKACILMGIEFDKSKAHSALYDSKVTADLFCRLVNKFKFQ